MRPWREHHGSPAGHKAWLLRCLISVPCGSMQALLDPSPRVHSDTLFKSITRLFGSTEFSMLKCVLLSYV